jgi:hypothetical protein
MQKEGTKIGHRFPDEILVSWMQKHFRAAVQQQRKKSSPVRLAYESPSDNTFLSEQTSHEQPASSTFLSEQTSTNHQPSAK